MPQAFSYVRFSSAQQSHGDSFRRQKELQARWLQSNPDYSLSSLSFEDLGKSGWSGAHLENAFGRLKEAVSAGMIQKGDAILVEAIDRAGRLEPMQMFPLLSEILLSGVIIITLDDGTEYTRDSVNGHHLFLLLAKIQQANNYSESLSRRIKASYEGRRQKAKAGEKIKRRTPVWLTSDGELIPEIQPHIKRIFEDYAAGIGERRIINRLRESEETPKALATVNPATIKRWLNNKQAIGFWGDIPNVYPPVITPDLFYRVQQKLADNSRTVAAPTKFLLTGLVKCGHCGKNFGIRRPKHSAAVYGCATRSRVKADCDNARSIPKQVLEHIRITCSLPFVQEALKSQQLTVSQKRLIEIDGELVAVAKAITNLADAIAQTGLVPEVQANLNHQQQRRQSLESERALLLASDDKNLVSQHDAIQLEAGLLDDDPMKLNALLQNAGFTITCYADGLLLVSGERYPWLYKGVERHPDRTISTRYVLEYLGEKATLPMLRQDHFDLVASVRGDTSTTPPADSELLAMIQRSVQVRNDDE
ncbi:MAG: recombinase family protein [Pseudomonas sp.]|uniref:recombinase family protein n=1 Tax=Pseudomonas sp. TaxID=306 RepID=UPI0039821499